jgi:hypothetical protein
MPQVDPAHNLNALLIGTGEFSFSKDATSAANAQVRGWVDFGNVVAFTPEVDAKTDEHIGSYRGVRRIDKRAVTQTKIQYKLKLDEANLSTLRLMFGATDTTGHLQSVLSAVAGQILGFTATPAVIGRWYNIKTAGGARLRFLTSVTIAAKVEGTDFVLDLKMGRVKFLTAQAADLTPTITAPAITAGQDNAFLGLQPLQAPVQSGYGKLICFDQYNPNTVVLEHEDFSCDVSIDSASEINGTGFTDITLTVTVTSDVGTVLVRNANQSAGL